MVTVYERHTLTALLILDLEDAFARSHGRLGEHPRPLEPLRFFLVQRDIQGILTRFNPVVELDVIQNASGFHLFFGREKIHGTRGAISTRALDLPPGRYTLQVRSPLYQTAEESFELPIGNANDPSIIRNYRLDLQASFAYPFPDISPLGQQAAGDCRNGRFIPRRGPTLLRGVLLDTGGKGVEGAQVRIANRTNTYITDSSGQWVLWFRNPPPTGPVEVLTKAPGQDEQSISDVCVVAGYETTLHQTALRGWVRKGTQPHPGALITVQGFPGQAVSDKHGGWAFTFPFTQTPQEVTVNAEIRGMPAQTRTARLVPRASVVVNPFQF
jgi:hypothetical protein